MNWKTTNVNTDEFLLDDVQCRGEENNIAECFYTRDENCKGAQGVELMW